MFSTLSFDPARKRPASSTPQSPDSKQRAKRDQVARACDNCRAFRIKCDSEKPCRNCRRKGRECGDGGNAEEFRTFASAMREIDRLSQRVKELEDQTQLDFPHAHKKQTLPGTRVVSKGPGFLPTNLDPLQEHGGNHSYWECITVDATHSGNSQNYGPGSLFYFVCRMSSFFQSRKHRAGFEDIVDRMSKISTSPFESNFTHMAGPINRIYLMRAYEESYLQVFWDAYHCLYPILNESEFWSYHRSLWETSQQFRKPSALIDILLAVCMQHGTSIAKVEGRPDMKFDAIDEIIASRWFYRRSQTLLTNQLETPSIMTLQSQVFSVVYLSNANSQNAAHATLSLAIRTGITLGLHLEPPADLPNSEREFRKRLWWTLYAIEMKFAMELGRPLGVNISQVTCGLPSDEDHGPAIFDQRTVVYKEAAYFSYSVHFIRLMLAIRAIYITFWDKCAAVLGRSKHTNLYENATGLEACAEYLESRMQYSNTWAREVPTPLKMKKAGDADAFGTEQVNAQFPPTASPWARRQSIFLELHYHNMKMNLYRLFICFPPRIEEKVPLTDEMANTCVAHARAIVSIIGAALADSDALDGYHEVFRWMWNATLTMFGYAAAYPERALPVRKPTKDALEIFEKLGKSFEMAVQAEQVIGELKSKMEEVFALQQEEDAATAGIESGASAVARIGSTGFSPYTQTVAPGMEVAAPDFSLAEEFVMPSWVDETTNKGFTGVDERSFLPWPDTGLEVGEDDDLLTFLQAMP